MNAIVATRDLSGWGFPLGANVTRMVRPPRRVARAGNATEADFINWMSHRTTAPARIEVMERFNVSRATAYRWVSAWRARKEAA